MAGIAIELEVSGIEAALARLSAIGKAAETEELADGLGALGVSQTQRRIESEKTTPAGQPWKPSIEGGSILFRTGTHLRDNVQHAVRGAHEVAWGSGWVGARIHNFGGVITPVNGKALVFKLGGVVIRAGRVLMPKREWLGLSADNEHEMEETAKAFIAKVAQ